MHNSNTTQQAGMNNYYVLLSVELNPYLNDDNYCPLEELFQFAYKIAHSTEMALLKIQSDILMSLDNGKAVVLVFLDTYVCLWPLTQ